MSQSKFHIIVSATAGNSIYPPIFFHLADLESWGWLESQLPLLHFHVWLSLCHSIRRYSICITADAVPVSHATLPSLVNKTLRYLNYSTWDSKSFPTQINHFTLFSDSDLEALILIPAISHSATNLPSASWSSQLDGAHRTTCKKQICDPETTDSVHKQNRQNW